MCEGEERQSSDHVPEAGPSEAQDTSSWPPTGLHLPQLQRGSLTGGWPDPATLSQNPTASQPLGAALERAPRAGFSQDSLDDVVAVQWLSCIRLFVTPWTAARQAPLSFTISQSLFKLMSNESVTPSNHLILCHPLPPVLNLSQHQGFSSESVGKI